MNDRQTFAGRIDILPYTGGASDGGVTIRLIDESSLVTLAEIDLTPYDFGQALVGRSNRPCSFWLGRSDLVGKIHENKTVNVPELADRYDEFDELVKGFEVDGWKADVENTMGRNGHRVNPDGSYKVIFRRYIDPPNSKGLKQ